MTMFEGKLNLWRKMSAGKKIAVILGGCFLIATVVIADVILLPKQDKAADPVGWALLDGENHQVLNEGEPLIYTALQESDRRKIRSGALDKERIANEGSVLRRPADFSELKFYVVSPENTLNAATPKRFSITIEDEGAEHTLQLVSFRVGGKTVLSPADPEFTETSYQIASSPDGKRHVLWTMGGMWLLEEGNLDEARKISSETHNNKTRRQLEVELTKLQQARGIDTEWEMIEWNYNPRFSPDGTKIVYNTNRVFETRSSSTVWIYDLETNTEKRLLGGGRYDYGVISWLNDGRLFIERVDGEASWEESIESSQYFLVDLQGEKRPLILPGGEYLGGFYVVHPSGLIAYPSYTSRAGKNGPIPLTVGAINFESMKFVPKVVRELAPYAYGTVSFNPSGTKLAFTYFITRNGRDGYTVLGVVDIARNMDLEIEQKQLEGQISGGSVKWLSDDQILLHTDRPVSYFSDEEDMYVRSMVFSTWIFNLGGGR